MKITKQGFEFFEEAFDYPYPFEQVRPALRAGVQHRARWRTPAASRCATSTSPAAARTRAFYEFRCSVILHEMAHMWFGDLVTMKWWDDLWLNESFAEWACYHAAVEATEFTESWTGFTNARKNWALRQDQLPSTHPIAADNYDLHAVEVNFDGITYAKGASVLKQLVAWVGLEPFLVGLRQYFKDHAFAQLRVRRPAHRAREGLGPRARRLGQGVAADQRRQHARRRVRARRRRHLRVVRASRQTAARRQPDAAPAPHRHRPVRRASTAAWSVVRNVETDVEGELTDVAELVGEQQPDLLLLNDGDLTYAKIRLDERSLATAGRAACAPLDDSLARALCWGAAWDMTRDAEMTRHRLRRAGAGQHRQSRPTRSASARIPGYAAHGRQPLLRPRARGPSCARPGRPGCARC